LNTELFKLFFLSTFPSDPPLLLRSDVIAIDPPKLVLGFLEKRDDLSEDWVVLITEPAPDLKDFDFLSYFEDVPYSKDGVLL
jgi:hypothetical protein